MTSYHHNDNHQWLYQQVFEVCNTFYYLWVEYFFGRELKDSEFFNLEYEPGTI